MKQFKIEIDGGQLNGTHRYYESKKAATIAARKIKPDPTDSIYIDMYWIDKKYNKHLIKTIKK